MERNRAYNSLTKRMNVVSMDKTTSSPLVQKAYISERDNHEEDLDEMTVEVAQNISTDISNQGKVNQY